MYGSPSDGHRFVGVKTAGPAIPAMQAIADLFTYVYEKRKRDKEQHAQHRKDSSEPEVVELNVLRDGFDEQKLNAAWQRPVMDSRSDQHQDVAARTSTVTPPPVPPPPNSAAAAGEQRHEERFLPDRAHCSQVL